MAKEHLNGIGFEPGVVHESWASRDHYWGTKDALVAAGLAQPEWFPGDPRCPRKQTYRTPDKSVEVSKRGRTAFDVLVEINEEERTRRQELLASRNAASKAQAWITSLPTSADGFRSGLIRFAEIDLCGLRNYAAKGSGGYRISKAALDELDIAISKVVSVLEGGNVAFSAKSRAAVERGILEECGVVIDPASRAFIASLMLRGPSAES